MSNLPFKIYVANLPLDMDQKAVTKYFTRYGPILNTFLMLDESGSSKGTAFITFQRRSDADYCIKDLNGANFEGKRLTVKEAINQTDTIKDPRRKNTKLPPFDINAEIVETEEIKQYKRMLEQLRATIVRMSNSDSV